MSTTEQIRRTKKDVDSNTAKVVDAFVAALPLDELPPIERILLYGSRARGDFHEESDVDIALIFKGLHPELMWGISDKIFDTDEVCDVIYEYKLLISPKIIWSYRIEHPLSASFIDRKFHSNVLKDGIEWGGFFFS